MSRAIGKHYNAEAIFISLLSPNTMRRTIALTFFVTAGDNYLKPYVSCEPEVSVTDRTADDDCLILASDGLWDVVSNGTACGVARMCLRGKAQALPCSPVEDGVATSETSDKACSDASMLLTKLALARHSTDNVSAVVVDLRKDT
jgi:protein phosphatase 2C